jgi:nucleotide-binding universal stress UspA family protein
MKVQLYIRHVAVGDPVQEIIKLIDKEDVDLVVMASRGSEGHFDVGSVAQKLLQGSTIPIVTIPVNAED